MEKIETGNLEYAALAKASGMFVEIIHDPTSNRVIFEFEATPEIGEIIRRYEARLWLFLPAKSIADARNTLYHAARAMKRAAGRAS